LRRTSMYASLFGISGALHLDIFEQPEEQVFFSDLLDLSGKVSPFMLRCFTRLSRRSR
jgi:hypothetical protein